MGRLEGKKRRESGPRLHVDIRRDHSRRHPGRSFAVPERMGPLGMVLEHSCGRHGHHVVVQRVSPSTPSRRPRGGDQVKVTTGCERENVAETVFTPKRPLEPTGASSSPAAAATVSGCFAVCEKNEACRHGRILSAATLMLDGGAGPRILQTWTTNISTRSKSTRTSRSDA